MSIEPAVWLITYTHKRLKITDGADPESPTYDTVRRSHLVRNGNSLCGVARSGPRRRVPWFTPEQLETTSEQVTTCSWCARIPPDSVTHHDLLEHGVTYRQIDHWCRVGWLDPISTGEGPGSRRLFPAAEYAIAVTMARLVVAHIPPEVAHDIARYGRTEIGPGIHVRIVALAAA